jgi:hypothetical protein
VTCFASAIARLALHFTQYASGFSSAIPGSPLAALRRLHKMNPTPQIGRNACVPARNARRTGTYPPHRARTSSKVNIARMRLRRTVCH